MKNFSPDQKLKAVARELSFRRNFYPKWVAVGRMTQDEADYQLAIMKAIEDDLHAFLIGQKSLSL